MTFLGEEAHLAEADSHISEEVSQYSMASPEPEVEVSRASKRQRANSEAYTNNIINADAGVVINANAGAVINANAGAVINANSGVIINSHAGVVINGMKINELDLGESKIERSLRTNAAPRLPFTKLLDDLVTTEVGEGAQTQVFRVYKGLLSSKSGFFRAALNTGFREEVESKIVLRHEGDKPLVFEYFLTWLYAGSLPTALEYLEVSMLEGSHLETLLDLYVMADRFIAPTLKNLTYMSILHLFNTKWAPENDFLDIMYVSTTEDDQLREYMAANCAYTLRRGEQTHPWMKGVKEIDIIASEVLQVNQGHRGRSTKKDIHPYEMERYRELREVVALRDALGGIGVADKPTLWSLGTSGNQDPYISWIIENLTLIGSKDNLPDMENE